jgi:predicted Zn finger-like uncharacterized protein
MIITCPKCSSKFKVDDSLVQKQGIKMRCSVCSNVFMPEIEIPDTNKDKTGKSEIENLQDKKTSRPGIPYESAPIDTGLTYSEDKPSAIKEPVIEKPSSTKKDKPRSIKNTLTGFLAMIIIIVALILSYSKGDGLRFFEKRDGTSAQQAPSYLFSLKDTDTAFKYLNTEDRGQILIIKGIVRKNENKPLKTLQVEIRIYDKDNKLIAAKTVYAGKVLLDTDYLIKKEPDVDAILMDSSKPLGVLSKVNEIPYSVAFYGQSVLNTSSIQAEVKEYSWQ